MGLPSDSARQLSEFFFQSSPGSEGRSCLAIHTRNIGMLISEISILQHFSSDKDFQHFSSPLNRAQRQKARLGDTHRDWIPTILSKLLHFPGKHENLRNKENEFLGPFSENEINASKLSLSDA